MNPKAQCSFSESACLLEIIWKGPKNISHVKVIQYSLLQLEMYKTKTKKVFVLSFFVAPFSLTIVDREIAHNDPIGCGRGDLSPILGKGLVPSELNRSAGHCSSSICLPGSRM